MLSFSGNKNKDLEAALCELRGRLNSKNLLNDPRIARERFITRYLKLNNNNVDKAEQQLEAYARYLKENDVDALEEWKAKPEEVAVNCIVGAKDRNGNPVMQSPNCRNYDLAGFMDRGEQDAFWKCANKIHWTFEKSLREDDTEAGTLIFDVNKVYVNGAFNAAIDYIRFMLPMSPGTLERVIVLNAPTIVKVLLQAARKIMPFPTDVVVFSEQDADWKKKLREYIPEDQLLPEFGGTFTSGYYLL